MAKKAAKKAAKKTAGKTSQKTAAKKTAGTKRAAQKGAAKGAAKKSAAKKSSGGRKTTGARRGTANAAFMAPVTPSAALSPVVGDKPVPRTEITKRLWAYIKKNGLQDQKNRRMINSDEALRPIFGKPTVNMFEMTKLVNKHLKA